jgi:chemotaxis protein CheD
MMNAATKKYSAREKLPPALPGFESVKRYRDRRGKCITARVLPGEFYVSKSDEMITTVLGSCVSACIRDPESGVGGINHFMLPGNDALVTAQCKSTATRYGDFAMEYLINEIFRYGGERKRLEIKLFGGGKILASMTEIGERNIAFVRQYLHSETLAIHAEDVGGLCPRKVNYYPKTGRVMVKKMCHSQSIKYINREQEYMHSFEQKPVAGKRNLF